jgi:MFS family permease
MVFYMLFIMGAGLSPNFGSLLVCRFFAGVFGATPLVCAGGSLSDLWTPAERVYAFPMFACFSFLGPLMGPVVGSWIGQTGVLSWRWVEWITLIFSGVVLAVVVLFQPESYGPILLKWKAQHLRRLTGDKRYRGAVEIRKTTLAWRLVRALYRPPLMTAQEPIIMLIALYLTVVYIVFFTFLTGYTFIFTDTYQLSQGKTGLCFLGICVGIIVSASLIPVNTRLRQRDIARAEAEGQTRVAPESRLYWAMFGAPAIPISLYWMGWTARASISLWSPLVASGVFGFGIICVFMSSYQYLIDSYEIYAASALASVTLIRYVVSGAMIEVSIPFYRNMGVAYTLTILASLSALLVPIPFVFYKYGPAIRKRSKYAF